MKREKEIKLNEFQLNALLSEEEKTVSVIAPAVSVFQLPNFQAEGWKKYRSF